MRVPVQAAAARRKVALRAGLLVFGGAVIVRGALLERRLRQLLLREREAAAHLSARQSQLTQRNEQLAEESRRDALTRLRNRHALADDLPALTALCRGSQEPVAFAICDIDHFKAYNDRLGHLAGDDALQAIAATVDGALRSDDVAYRFGGEELLLVLRNTDAHSALAVAERVRAAVERVRLPHPDGVGEIMTVSVGVAAGSSDPDALLARADGALYAAKRAGRNCVRAAGIEHQLPPGRTDAERPAAPAPHRRTLLEAPVPRHLLSMLAISRAAVSGQGALPVVEALAETISSELQFGAVAVNLVDRTNDELRVVSVVGDESARATLLGTSAPRRPWGEMVAAGRNRCGAVWRPAGSYDWSEYATSWVPPIVVPPGPDEWHPDDMLLLPLHGGSGELLGVVSVDQPHSGRRPSDAELAVLMAAADHAGIALEQSQRAGPQTVHSDLLLEAMMLLAETLDLRCSETARHSRTVGAYARQIAVALGLPHDRVQRIQAAGVLHDLGKLGIADVILYKTGPLDAAQVREVQRHTELGARILHHAGMHDIAEWVRAHHERPDGTGYPSGLAPEQIPLEARILAVADAYEAMTSDRPYRRHLSADSARRELRDFAATQFDPAIVEVFLDTLRAPTALSSRSAPDQVANLVIAAP